MPAASFHELPDRVPMSGPGLKAKATERQWDILSKQAVATYICTEDGEPCEKCAQYCGEQMRLPEAEEKIPQHPNCRCWYEWDWDPELSSLSMTALTTRASGRSTDTTMTDTTTVTKSATAAGVVDKTPNGEDDGEDEYIRVPISSTSTDRDGDDFSKDGLQDLRDQIRETPRPVFENHGFGGGLFGTRYDWKDILGTQVDAEIEGGSDAARTLYSYIKPNSENERADQLLSYIKAGQAVGFSIGFRVLGKDGDSDEGYTFHETDLLETSAVGIQSNPDAVPQTNSGGTVEALAKSAGEFDADLDEETVAKHIVSEAFARGAGGTGAVAGEPLDTRTPDETTTETKDTTTMSDDDTYITEQQLEKKLDEHQNDLIKDIAAELDGSLGEDGEDESEGKDGDVDPELKELAKQNHEAIADLKEAVEDGETEDADTTNKAKKDAAEGEQPDGEGGEAEEKAVPDEGWM